ncbi:hypothetical protein N7532_000591 [Penicillium argentinense]|uniref:SET domain-containing protein n=1 Tax=Penicillium argentinense TaxID=1131581 RepID=A0A9W9KNZ9_9EURO|nr:uncharacterized protein N7532_000591 [Penicillium argentinense]KAJ5112546.1 hypothetical protein N7532_000591 [Penicillium argentinense]
MTDTSSLAITHATTDPYPVPAPLGSPIANGAISDSVAPDEEEPYTIKCICLFDEDDGSTVFCEGCETWQHIICYYPDNRVPDVHNCVDCEPRLLDSRRATERQRQRRMKEQSEDGDRKKRSGAKSQKKKSREGDVNGFSHQRSESGAREQPPAKKPKTSHRSSASISAIPGAPTIPPESRKRRSSTSVAPSPTKSFGPSIPLYSNEFLHLYDRDDEHEDRNSNLFVNVSLVGEIASWVKDPDALARISNGRPTEDTFNMSDSALDRSHWPTLTTDTITDSNLDIGGRHPTWKIVKTQDAVRKDGILGELTGKVGVFDDYCLDPNNRWQELRHPEPFVFFSSHLPLYIDSRHEGSVLRYTRRSCRPNVTMKIYITNEVEYHFCFVAKEDIPPNSEITIMWYLDAPLFESSNGLVKQESGDSATEAAATCLSNTLANFGGCACGNTQNCLLAKIDRRRHPKQLEAATKQPNGKRKKAKTKSTASPRDTGAAPLSRAGSETTKHPEDDDALVESRSNSGSIRGQPQSRDLSPSTPQLHELTSRERRKIAEAEKQFQQLEQHDHRTTTQKKKKKRASGTSVQSPAAVSTPTQAGYFGAQKAGKGIYLNTGSLSRSPTTAQSPGPMPAGRHGSPGKVSGPSTPGPSSGRSTYVDAAVQIMPDQFEDPSVKDASPPHKSSVFLPPKMRLLKRFSMDRLRVEENARQQLSSAGSDSVAPFEPSSPSLTRSPAFMRSPALSSQDKSDAGTGDTEHAQRTPTTTSAIASDMEMLDAPIPSGIRSPSAGRDLNRPQVPPPWPSTAAHNTRIPGVTPIERGNLRVSMPPPSVPSIPPAASPGSASNTSPASPNTVDTTSPSQASAQVPSTAPTPTPTVTKKKLSLGDYLIRKGTMATTPTLEKSQVPSIPLPVSQKSPTTPESGPPASADGAQTPTKTSPDSKADPHDSPDVAMKDAPESNQPHAPSIISS